MTPAQRLPAFQFYPGDWRKDPGILSLDYEARGVWFEILLLMHESDDRGKLLLNGKPMPIEAVAQILGLEQAQVEQIVSKLEERGVPSRDPETGALMNRRMVRDEAQRQAKRRAGAIGGRRSRGGGRPPKTSEEQVEGKQETTSSVSSSTSKTTETSRTVREYWVVYLKELGGDPPLPNLSEKRARLLTLLHTEQLSQLSDPTGVFRSICQALKASRHHMGRRAYQMPESFLQNADRRETWTRDGLALMNGAAGLDEQRRLGMAELDAIDGGTS